MRDPDDGLRPLFIKHLPPPKHLQPIELGMTSRGVPDLYYCLEGVTGWVECKATSTLKLRIRPTQVGWILTHVRHGGRVFVAVRRRVVAGPRKAPRDELWIMPGANIEELRATGLKCPSAVLGWWDGGPKSWNWGEVRELLCGGWSKGYSS